MARAVSTRGIARPFFTRFKCVRVMPARRANVPSSRPARVAYHGMRFRKGLLACMSAWCVALWHLWGQRTHADVAEIVYVAWLLSNESP
jgi:hypothetical protein